VSSLRRASRAEEGFTLLEVMIAMAIMMVAFASILMVQSSSIEASIKAKRMNVVGMLAKSLMIDTELMFQGKPFAELKKEEAGQFKEPYQDYAWKRTVKEVKFPNLDFSSAAGGAAGDKAADNTQQEGDDRSTEIMTRLITKFLSNAVREVTVTVSWKKGTGSQSFAVSTYWVDLNSEFAISE
jgi:prepilin-type N-terminal cleavage/methylation domain-containing protein